MTAVAEPIRRDPTGERTATRVLNAAVEYARRRDQSRLAQPTTVQVPRIVKTTADDYRLQLYTFTGTPTLTNLNRGQIVNLSKLDPLDLLLQAMADEEPGCRARETDLGAALLVFAEQTRPSGEACLRLSRAVSLFILARRGILAEGFNLPY